MQDRQVPRMIGALWLGLLGMVATNNAIENIQTEASPELLNRLPLLIGALLSVITYRFISQPVPEDELPENQEEADDEERQNLLNQV